MKRSGSQVLLELLRQEGVEYIFGNPGTTELPLVDALVREREIRYLLGLHEGVAMSMADGYAQASGRLAMVNVHVSPGLGNAMGMLYDALKSAAPVLVTAGQHDQSVSATEPILWSELPPVARPFVKWAGEVRRLADLPRLVHRAAKTALAHPTGPVFLSLPADVLNQSGEVELGAPSRVARRVAGERAAIEEAAALLAGAERPLLVAGDWVAHGDALAELVELAETLGAPVLSESFAGTCNFPFRHPLHAGSMPRPAPRIRARLAQHDVVLAVCGPVFMLPLPSDEEPIPPGVSVLHLDVDPWEIGKNYPAKIGIQGDPKATLPLLCEAVRRAGGKALGAAAGERRAQIGAAHRKARDELVARARAEAAGSPMSALAFSQALADALPEEAVLVDESISISSSGVLRQLLACADAKSFFGPRGGGVGWGIPAALGVKLGLPRRPVVALIGDGSALYSWQGLWTAAHERIAVVFLVLNNGCYRILKERALALKGYSAADKRFVGLDIEDPAVDFVALAAALGVQGERVGEAGALGAALRRALGAGRPYVIDVAIAQGL
ncbi:MAG TPA: thiamine pyrophosphate-binding protein [Burkholderiales bacterium]